jgi:hypothetical protein
VSQATDPLNVIERDRKETGRHRVLTAWSKALQTTNQLGPNKGQQMMYRTKKLFLPMLMLGVMACNDANAPVIEDAPESTSRVSLNHLRWAAAPQFSATAGTTFGEVPLADPEWGALLEGGSDYTVSFWAVNGNRRHLDIRYEHLDDSYVRDDGRFFKIEITDVVALADGTPVAVGDSVLITVTVDTETLVVDLQPSGIQFGTEHPTKLEMYYGGADPDFNADAVVNGDDSYIETDLLGMWVHETTDNPWDVQNATHDLGKKLFKGYLEHFSEYAISW